MTKHLTYIIGEPGSGKTTLVDAITDGITAEVLKVPYVTWTHYSPKVCQLGHRRETFGGTDALGMAAQNHVLDWLATDGYQYVLAEGDRLANSKFFTAVRAMGYQLHLWVLDVPQEVLEDRRADRNAAIGKAQDDRWLATRKTKITNLRNNERCKVISGDKPIGFNVDILSTDPVIKQLLRLKVQENRAVVPSSRGQRARVAKRVRTASRTSRVDAE